MFMDELKNTLNEEFNTSVTENGALGYRTSGKELLDMNFAVSSMRNMSEDQIVEKFVKAFYEDKLLAVKWLFFARDIRGGMGERRLFRTCLKHLAEDHADIAKAIIPLVPEYGRWDDLWCLLDTELVGCVMKLVHTQLIADYNGMSENKPISLLAKWMPSIRTSSDEKKRLARIMIKHIGCNEYQYRKMLSAMRSYLKIVEIKMSRNEWSEIDYAVVPSRANLRYAKTFLEHDEERRRLYLESLNKGETKINAGVLFPHDIVHRYCDNNGWTYRVKSADDTTLEEMWKALPDYVNGAGNTICVADGSGSMTDTIGNTSVMAITVANALAIYFAERSSGQFKDYYITFSERPQLVDLSKGNSLREKFMIAKAHNEVADTNIYKVFDLILQTAIKKNMSQDELPQNILILSDMEFNYCAVGTEKRLFKQIEEDYAAHGYKLPRLVFWNILSRTGTIPVKENDLGVALVSGFSPSIMRMVLSNSTDPFECLLEQLNSERYTAVEEVMKGVI